MPLSLPELPNHRSSLPVHGHCLLSYVTLFLSPDRLPELEEIICRLPIIAYDAYSEFRALPEASVPVVDSIGRSELMAKVPDRTQDEN